MSNATHGGLTSGERTATERYATRSIASEASRKWFARFAVAVLAWNIPVILWGAYVRASFSGDGCGARWPFCNGQVIPQNMSVPTAIEFTHRMMTSVDSVGVIAMLIWALLAFPRPHAVRRYAVLSLIFLLIEALLGAGLVLLRYVARDQSAGRAVYLSAHLTNTLLLLGTLTITAWLAARQQRQIQWSRIPRAVLWTLPVTVAVSVTGAVAALGDTLYPATSVASGLSQDFSSGVSLLLRLRIVHPFVAVAGSLYVLWVSTALLKRNEDRSRSAATATMLVVIFQLFVGVLNISLLAPEWIQLFHLLVADLVWIAVIVMMVESAAVGGKSAFGLAEPFPQ